MAASHTRPQRIALALEGQRQRKSFEIDWIEKRLLASPTGKLPAVSTTAMPNQIGIHVGELGNVGRDYPAR